jgi:undecaprenyl diphosphate synthase
MLMTLLRRYLRREAARLIENGVRLRVVGRRDRLPPEVREAIALAEAETAAGTRMTLRLAIDYSSRHALLEAVRTAVRTGAADVQRADLAELLGRAMNADEPSDDVDLLIRTGGEQRLSDFLLWECAYAELHFTSVMWPDFGANELAAAIGEFMTRDRRFGRVAVAV